MSQVEQVVGNGTRGGVEHLTARLAKGGHRQSSAEEFRKNRARNLGRLELKGSKRNRVGILEFTIFAEVSIISPAFVHEFRIDLRIDFPCRETPY